MNKKKWIVIIIVVLLVLLGLVYFRNSKPKKITSLAQDVVDDMKLGWNLGDTLDSVDYNTDPIFFKNGYQIMAVYSTKNYSGWDAQYSTYSLNNECSLSWNITSLNSSLSEEPDKFSITLINNDLQDSGSEEVQFTITKALFTKANGEKIKLDSILGDYSEVVKEGKTSSIIVDLASIKEISSGSDIINGTLDIKLKINSYPKSIKTENNNDIYALVDHYETLWGNVKTTKEMIDKVKEGGFNAIRIPITFYNHIDNDGNIQSQWLDRVEEIVNYVLDNDMYCIINVHHDVGVNAWINADFDKIDETSEVLKNLWEQIAYRFKEYDNKLLFEGFNEILNSDNEWKYPSNDCFVAVNKLNQVFVDTVRGTGGNNKSRFLIVTPYAASTLSNITKKFELPKDSIEEHLIVDVHSYIQESDFDDVASNLANTFIEKEIPVIIGEFGITNEDTTLEEREEYVDTVLKESKEIGITCFWWDNGGVFNSSKDVNNFALLDRTKLEWFFPEIIKTMNEAISE